MSWAHPWDDAPKSRRGIIGGGGRGNGHNAGANKRNPITGELALEQAVWSDVGKQVVAAAHAKDHKAFAGVPKPKYEGDRFQPPPSTMLTAVTGPFDMNGQGVRDVRAPERLPEAMRYAQCQTAVPVPSKLDRSLVSESGRLPSQYLKRAGKGGVCGYNGNGIHSRAPNVLALPLASGDGAADARARRESPSASTTSEICYAAGRLAVLSHVESGQQRCYEAHTQPITCLALHPSNTRIASAQIGNATAGTAAYVSVWDVQTLKELARVGWSHSVDGGPGDGGPMQPCFTTSVCAIAFSPDGSILLAVGTSSGDQHTLVAFDWASGKVLAKSVAMTARPCGVFDLLVHFAKPQTVTKAQATMQAKHAAEAAVAAERVASRTGDPKAKAAAEAAAKKAAELATLAAQTKGNVKLGNGDLLVVVIGQAPAPKYTTLSKGADGVSWSFPPNWKLGLVNAGDGNNKPPPRICTSGLFGGAAFPAVSSGSPGGLTICGTHRQRHSSSDATHTTHHTTPSLLLCTHYRYG